MDQARLYRYLARYRQDLFTITESQAAHVLDLEAHASIQYDGKVQQMLLRRAEQHRTEDVSALLQNGPEAFRTALCERILREYGTDALNLCPKCQSLTRTPRARRCPTCFFDWH